MGFFRKYKRRKDADHNGKKRKKFFSYRAQESSIPTEEAEEAEDSQSCAESRDEGAQSILKDISNSTDDCSSSEESAVSERIKEINPRQLKSLLDLYESTTMEESDPSERESPTDQSSVEDSVISGDILSPEESSRDVIYSPFTAEESAKARSVADKMSSRVLDPPSPSTGKSCAGPPLSGNSCAGFFGLLEILFGNQVEEQYQPEDISTYGTYDSNDDGTYLLEVKASSQSLFR